MSFSDFAPTESIPLPCSLVALGTERRSAMDRSRREERFLLEEEARKHGGRLLIMHTFLTPLAPLGSWAREAGWAPRSGESLALMGHYLCELDPALCGGERL
jgi:hypothetical protein